jgi:hypothetical protein
VVEDSENAAMAAGFPFEEIVFSHYSKVRKKWALNKKFENGRQCLGAQKGDAPNVDAQSRYHLASSR